MLRVLIFSGFFENRENKSHGPRIVNLRQGRVVDE